MYKCYDQSVLDKKVGLIPSISFNPVSIVPSSSKADDLFRLPHYVAEPVKHKTINDLDKNIQLAKENLTQTKNPAKRMVAQFKLKFAEKLKDTVIKNDPKIVLPNFLYSADKASLKADKIVRNSK